MNSKVYNLLLSYLNIEFENNEKIWDFSKGFKSFYMDLRENLDVSKYLDSSVSPKDITDIETNIKYLFPNHFFKVIHAIHENTIDSNVNNTIDFKTGEITILDLGCGPGTASLAVLDYIFQYLSAYYQSDMTHNIKLPIKINFILIDSSEICLLTAQMLITKYYYHLCKNYSWFGEIFKLTPHTYNIKGSFPDIIDEINDLSKALNMRVNLFIMSNLIAQIYEYCRCYEGENGMCFECSSYYTRDCYSSKIIRESINEIANLRSNNNNFLIIQEYQNIDLIKLVIDSHLEVSNVWFIKRNYSPVKGDIGKPYSNSYGKAMFYWKSKVGD